MHKIFFITLSLLLLSSCFMNPFRGRELNSLEGIEVKSWPRDKNIRMVFSHEKFICAHDTHQILVQSRSVCQELFTNWQMMAFRDGIIDDEYMITNGICPTCPDTITIMVDKITLYDSAGDCVWLFRAQVRDGKRFSKWKELPFGIRLDKE